MKLNKWRVRAAALSLLLVGVAHAQQATVHEVPRALAYATASQTPVPIPPSEVGLHTVTSEP